MPLYNKESGYGKHSRAIPFNGQGQVIVVARTAAAGRQILEDTFKPFAGVPRYASTIDAAIGQCTASRGDIIYVCPNHTETVSTAAGIAQDVAGVSIIGLGEGNNRPVITFSAVAATWAVSANNCVIKNIVGTTSIDVNTNPFNITGNNCTIDIEWQDSSSTVEALRAIRLDTADNAVVKLKYLGFTAGDATVNAIRLDDCDNVRIEIDAYGRVDATGWVEMVDVASTNVYVTGRTFCLSVTNGARNVVDTITASTWYMDVQDMSAGARYTGGSAAAIASDDISTVTTNLATLQAEVSGAAGIVTFPTGAAAANAVSIAEVLRYTQENIINGAGTTLPSGDSIYGVLAGASGITTFPTGAAAANAVSIAEVLRYTQENIINGTGTALPTNDSIYGVLAGASGITTFPAAALPANNVSIAEVMREHYDQSDKAVTNTTATLVNGTTIFTIAGGPIEILSLVARCVTGNDGTASTLQWSADPTDGVSATISGASASIASVLAGAMVVFQGNTLATAPIVNTTGVGLGQTVTNGVVVGAGIITIVIGVGSTTGTWQHHLRYRPLSRGVTVT